MALAISTDVEAQKTFPWTKDQSLLFGNPTTSGNLNIASEKYKKVFSLKPEYVFKLNQNRLDWFPQSSRRII